ncbi:MAG: carbohydrate ABC transporter permease [Chloroflexi bacterium]|nr:carbohydrate ABC transporter permease [Chloroflexota bacterium]
MIEKNTSIGRLLTWSAMAPVLFMAFLMIVPYYWMVIGAFKNVPELRKVPPTFVVENPTLNNFYDEEGNTPPNHQEGLFQRFKDTKGGFARIYANSIFISVSVTFASLLIASLTAFVLAKHRFPGRNFIFIMFMASMMVPWQVTLIPNFLIMRDLNWINSFRAIVIPASAQVFAVFFLRQFMLSLPDELLDAARVDGAGELRIWWSIILPLVRPALTAIGLIIFLGQWNNLVWPLIVLRDANLRTIPLAISLINQSLFGPTTLGLVMAAAFLTSIPTLILFIVFQKEFVRGITMSGMKG